MVAIWSYITRESPYIVGPGGAERSMMEKNGNKSAMAKAAHDADLDKKAKDYKACRLSIAPMMDRPAVAGISNSFKCLRA